MSESGSASSASVGGTLAPGQLHRSTDTPQACEAPAAPPAAPRPTVSLPLRSPSVRAARCPHEVRPPLAVGDVAQRAPEPLPLHAHDDQPRLVQGVEHGWPEKAYFLRA